MTVFASRRENNALLLLPQLCLLNYVHEICLFDIIRDERELLVQARDSHLEFFVSLLRVSDLYNPLRLLQRAVNELLAKQFVIIFDHGGREEQSLPLLRDGIKDYFELWPERVLCEHPVGLIEHQELQILQVVIEIVLIVLDEMDQSSRGCDDDVRDF